MKNNIREKSLAPSLNTTRDINLYDPTWNYEDDVSIDALLKASLLFYTQHARELGAEGPDDPKVLNKLEDKLIQRRVPEDIVDKIIFKMRLRAQQDRVKSSKKASMKELRQFIRDSLNEE